MPGSSQFWSRFLPFCPSRRRGEGERGATFVEVLVAAAGVLGIAAGILEFILFQQSTQKKINLNLSATIQRSNLSAIINNPNAWAYTISDPGSCNSQALACTVNAGGCPPNPTGAEAPLKCIYDSQKGIVYNAKTSTSALTDTGAQCDASSVAAGSPPCVLQPIITWATLCQAAPCAGAHYKVHVQFAYLGTDSALQYFQPSNYEMIIIK